MSSSGFGGEEIKEESSWRYPLAIFLATLVLCAIFLYYYVGPSVNELGGNTPSPAISEEVINLTVNEVPFAVPANYTVYPRDRRGGERDEIVLYALWPTFSGYSPQRRDEFVDDAPDVRRIDLTIAARTSAFDEATRIEKLYMPLTTDSRGIRTPIQLLKHEFKERYTNVETNGYVDTELYIGEAADGAVLALFCYKVKDEVKNPDCWRQYELGDDVTVIYRFKRPYLSEWRKIDADVRTFVKGLRAG